MDFKHYFPIFMNLTDYLFCLKAKFQLSHSTSYHDNGYVTQESNHIFCDIYVFVFLTAKTKDLLRRFEYAPQMAIIANGLTPAHVAALSGSLDVLKALVEFSQEDRK